MKRPLTDKQKSAIKELAWGRVPYGSKCSIHKRVLDQLARQNLVEVAQDNFLRSHVYLTPAGRIAAMEIDPQYKAFQEEA